jgi:hypothetical protein
VTFHPSGNHVATAGFDGVVRFVDVTNGQMVNRFVPVGIEQQTAGR